MGRSFSSGVADGLQDLRTMQIERRALDNEIEADTARSAERAALRKVDELTAQLHHETGTLNATRALLVSMRKIYFEKLTEDDLKLKRKAWLEGARAHIHENASDAQKIQIRHACKSVDVGRWPDVHDLVPPPKPVVIDPRSFQAGEVTEVQLPSFLVLTKTRWIFEEKEYTSKKLATDAREKLLQDHNDNLQNSMGRYEKELAALAKWEADFLDCITF